MLTPGNGSLPSVTLPLISGSWEYAFPKNRRENTHVKMSILFFMLLQFYVNVKMERMSRIADISIHNEYFFKNQKYSTGHRSGTLFNGDRRLLKSYKMSRGKP
jgi:hypothetical protein